MILAAGRGTRLGPLGLAVPKVLVEVGGDPLLARHLRYLEREGVNRVVVNVHHLAEQIQHFAREYDGGVELVVVGEPELLGTAGGVRNALPHLGPRSFLVLYGDVLIEESLAPLVAAHERSGAVATVTVYESSETEGKGVVEVDENDYVRRFVEKRANPKPGLVNAGLYVVEPDLVAALPSGTASDFGHDVLPQAVERGERILAYRLQSAVLDIGTPEALALAQAAARSGER